MATILDYNAVIAGNWTFTGALTPSPGCVKNSHFSDAADSALSYLKQHTTFALWYGQANGSDVASATQVIYTAQFPAEVLSVDVRLSTAPTGGDKQFTVDVQQAADGSGSWSSLLSSVITASASDADDDVLPGVLIGDPSLDATDSIRVVVTASGSTGSQGQGFAVSIRVAEAPTTTELA